MDDTLTPEMLLGAYCSGLFPMAEPDDPDTLYWYRPDPRAVIPLGPVRLSRRLRSLLKPGELDVRTDTAFEDVMNACAGREETWISPAIIRAYSDLHRLGFAHSVETYREGRLVGGLYGVSIGAAFFGESMFSLESHASSLALVHLIQLLREGGFQLLDIQFLTDHLVRFGALEIGADEYEARLEEAIEVETFWPRRGDPESEPL